MRSPQVPPNDDERRAGLGRAGIANANIYANQLANQQAGLQAQQGIGIGPGYQGLEEYQAQELAARAARDYQTQLMGEQERGLRGWLPIATGDIGAMPRRAGVNREPRRTFGSAMWDPEPQERVAAKAPEPPSPPPIPRYERLLGEDPFGDDDE